MAQENKKIEKEPIGKQKPIAQISNQSWHHLTYHNQTSQVKAPGGTRSSREQTPN